MSTGCQASAGAGYADGETRNYYDRAGHWLAALRLRGDDASRVTIRIEATRLGVDGAGCALSVSLSRP